MAQKIKFRLQPSWFAVSSSEDYAVEQVGNLFH